MNPLTAPSWAKINLTLRVCGRRPDGFHEIESLVAWVGLADDVTVEPRDGREITLGCSDASIPVDESNLAARAGLLLQSRAAVERGAHIHLHKRIPAGAGLGGGSSNAATTLRLLNRAWKPGFTNAELADLGATLGSDVPLFLGDCPLNIMRGRGEQLDPVRAALAADVLLALPPLHSPTAAVYRAFAAAGRRFDRADAIALLADSIERSGQSELEPNKLISLAFNDLEQAAFTVTPELGEFAARLRNASNLPFCMSGSGAAFFTLLAPGSGAIERERDRLAVALPNARFVATKLVEAPFAG